MLFIDNTMIKSLGPPSYDLSPKWVLNNVVSLVSVLQTLEMEVGVVEYSSP